MLKEMNILEVSDKELIQVIRECNDAKERNAFILHKLHQNAQGDSQSSGVDPEELFVNTARVASRLLVKRNYFHKDGELVQFKKEKKAPAKKVAKKAAK